ncbi:hypothetical protein D9619_010414 [Psilocybe cf. subviscida]|uniref:Protein kinase domain-containing protein n=1 Tax=Psilocybe cf. subviscida TaxID=2480587 RepID=A0A8H5ASS4_9AGAR|nr:hypothetical protein D9619_010414 [Psilocybe cf. subviscida]
MPPTLGHKQTPSLSQAQNHKAQLANAYNELGKELSSSKIRVVGNYTLGKVIGEGAYGKVRMGTHRLTSTRVAIKQIPKAMSAQLTREIHHHRQLHHPHITQMYEVIATESHIWIVTELCCGGELFDYLVEKGRLSEDETRVIFGQLCLAVAYLHQNGIVHRDLKLENVLLDERCRVKLGDFGFTREFERGSFMETFCGTTGYASPEMLQGQKYQGPEVDVWSLGIILYCLLTGTLPFDDDEESVMRTKIIQGDFEDPVWLSLESRDLIKSILLKDTAKRTTIPQILAHPWFTVNKLTYEPESPISALPQELPDDTSRSSQGTHSEDSNQDPFSPLAQHRDLESSAPTTPDKELSDPFATEPSIQRYASNSTIKRNSIPDIESLSLKLKPATVVEEDAASVDLRRQTHSPLQWASGPPSAGSKAPPTHPVRTPARTKRRSVSSILSESGSPTIDKTPTPLPFPSARDLDFVSMLSATTPVIFSTPAERQLLNTLSLLGFDTAQIVHSVLSNACDAAGSIWWMLRRKDDKQQQRPDGETGRLFASPTDIDTASILELEAPSAAAEEELKTAKKKRSKLSMGVQTDEPDVGVQVLNLPQPPQFSIVPPTPTYTGGKVTPPRNISPTKNPLLSPSISSIDITGRSYPSTPSGSVKEKDKDGGAKGRKPRSGSVSIMQRATTALEAAGLVRKKSSEAVKEEKERGRERSRETERSKDKDKDRRSDEPRSSHGSGGSSKLTKSPPSSAKGLKDHPPTTPPPAEHSQAPGQMGSPWVLAEKRESISQPHHGVAQTSTTPVQARGEMIHSYSTPNFTEAAAKPTGAAKVRDKANLLTTFRLWFNDDRRSNRKEKRREADIAATERQLSGKYTGSQRMTPARRNSNSSNAKFNPRATSRNHRPSMSSRRSSSVNSRRSSGQSIHMLPLDSPQLPARRSFGAHTPNSEAAEYSSRPSSIRSISRQQRHRKSPSQSSAGSIHLRTASPMQKYHRRGGSGSSTRVVRQITPSMRPPHVRSNSAASSIHSPPSSRPTSWYEPSDAEGIPRTASPYRTRPRRSLEDSSRPSATTTFVAQKRSGPFASPAYGGSGTAGRSSWKKSWGMEPPGWSSRTAHLPIEVLAILPANEPVSIRDVFSGKQTYTSAGDESDWVDEDDEIFAFAGGLGQTGSSASGTAVASSSLTMSMPTSTPMPMEHKPVTLSPAPRGHRNGNAGKGRTTRMTAASGSRATAAGSSRGKAGHSPSERSSPLPMEAGYDSSDSMPRGGRRQLPVVRSGPAAIQEEDEEEEE